MGDDAIGEKVPSDGDDSDEEELAPAGPQEAIAGLNLMDPIVQLMLRIEKSQELQCTKNDMKRLEKDYKKRYTFGVKEIRSNSWGDKKTDGRAKRGNAFDEKAD